MVQHSELISDWEQSMSEETIDFIQQALRTICLYCKVFSFWDTPFLLLFLESDVTWDRTGKIEEERDRQREIEIAGEGGNKFNVQNSSSSLV